MVVVRGVAAEWEMRLNVALKSMALGGEVPLLHYEKWLHRQALQPRPIPHELAQPFVQARTCANELMGDFSSFECFEDCANSLDKNAAALELLDSSFRVEMSWLRAGQASGLQQALEER
eukprot:2956609-Lingulodinium_polyedra.AAC.1